MGVNKMSNVSELQDIAKKEIDNLKNAEILLRDLFYGYGWNRISRSDRLLSGTLFFNCINTSNNEVIPI